MNNKKIYENVLILRGTFTEKEYKTALQEIKKHLEPLEIKKLDEKGKKKLAYAVDNNSMGYFVVIELKATEQEILELERFYRINSDILKFMSVRKYRR